MNCMVLGQYTIQILNYRFTHTGFYKWSSNRVYIMYTISAYVTDIGEKYQGHIVSF